MPQRSSNYEHQLNSLERDLMKQENATPETINVGTNIIFNNFQIEYIGA
jgi:hypothetical protein